MEANGIRQDAFKMMIGNLITDCAVQKEVGFACYDIVVANILADVLVPLTPVIKNQLKSGGIYITSGIIDEKEKTVADAVKAAGFTILEITRQGEWVSITGTDVNHIKNVLRMKPGEEIAVSNGRDGREYRCAIEKLEEEQIICRLLFIKEEGVELPAKIYLFQGLPKADKMELIIQKAVELGAFEIIPVETKRAVVKPPGGTLLRRRRQNKANGV